MSKIVVDELINTLTQSITLNQDRIMHIEALKIRLYMYNAPSGTFTLSVKLGATTLSSQSFTSADIKSDLSTSNNYALIDKLLLFDLPLKKGTYSLELSASGYTYSQNSFISWVKSHENIFNEQSSVADSFLSNPFDVLIYENKRCDLWV